MGAWALKMGYSGTSVTVTAEQIADQVWNEITSGHTVSGSTGQSIGMLRNVAISGDTSNSLMDRMDAAITTRAAIPTGISDVVTASENVTTTYAPSSGEVSVITMVFKTDTVANIATVEFSLNKSVFIDRWAINNGTTMIANDAFGIHGTMAIDSDSAFRWTNPGTSGSYVVHVGGYKFT